MSTFFHRFAAIALAVTVLGIPGMGQVTRMMSISTGGTPARANCYECEVSGNGRFVCFETAANLGDGGHGAGEWIYLRDREEQQTIFVAFGGDLDRNSVANDGDVAFRSTEALVAADTNAVADIYVWDRATDTLSLVSVDSLGSPGNGSSGCSQISLDSRYFVYSSSATNLVAGDTNTDVDIFRHDRQTGETIRVSVDSNGSQVLGNCITPAISANGRYVAFGSTSTTLVAGDTNGQRDLFRHDCDTNENILVSQSTAGVQGDADAGFSAAISEDGQTLVFQSSSANFVINDTNGENDIFVRYVATGITERVNVDAAGIETPAGSSSRDPDISGDGSTVVFISTASMLVPGDSNNGQDAFVKDVATGSIELATTNTYGEQQDSASTMLGVHVSTDGNILAFDSAALNLHRETPDRRGRIFWRNRASAVQVTSVTPDRAAGSGDRQVNILGSGFTNVADTVVWFDRTTDLERYGTVLSVEPDRIVIRTPSGVVGSMDDIVVECSAGGGALRDGFEYISNAIDSRFGNTNIAAGTLEDVITINGSAGVGDQRIVCIPVATPFTLDVAAPSSRTTAGFVLYAFLGQPTVSTATPLGQDLGRFSFPPVFAGGSPIAIWNNLGHFPLLGDPDFASSPAPTQLLSIGGLNHPRTVTFQAIIQDDNARIAENASISNAVVLKVE